MRVKEAGIMKILNRKLWTGSVVLASVALISAAAVAGGFELAMVALGALTLAGMIGAGIYVFMRVKRYSKALRVASLGSDAGARPISNQDKRSIIKHLNELFEIEREQSEKELVGVKPITGKDKRLIVANIDEFFKSAREQDRKASAETEPISEEDKRLIMAYIDRLFDTGGEQNRRIFA